MRFQEAYYLNYLWLAVLLAFLFVLAQKAKNSALKKFAEESLLKEITASVSPKRRIIKSALIVLIFIFSALSRLRINKEPNIAAAVLNSVLKPKFRSVLACLELNICCAVSMTTNI